MERLATDRAAALGALYDRHGPIVYGLALAILADPDEARDLTQEVFVGLCNRFRFDSSRGALSSYLAVLTRSRAIDRLRARGRRATAHERLGSLEQPPNPTPPEQVSLFERSRQVRSALARLPENQRQVLELAYFDGLTQAEIAERLRTPLGTIKTWTRSALAGLQRPLRDLAG